MSLGLRGTAPEQHAETKTTVHFAIAANLTIALVKGAVAILTGSAALVAETAHSFADTGNQILLRISLSRAEKRPDERHPFGYGRERFFWALLVAVMMFVAGALFTIGQGVLVFVVGSSDDSLALAYGVLAVSFVAESVSLLRATRQIGAGARRTGWSFSGYLRNTTDPTTKTVLFEDIAAVLGVAVAAAGIAAHQVTGDIGWEGVASIAIGVGLAAVALNLGRTSMRLLIGEPARPEERDAIRRAVLAHPEVQDIVDLRTVHLGPHQLFVAMRLDFSDGVTSGAIEDVSTEIEEELHTIVPDVVDVFLDATNSRTPKSSAYRQLAS